MTKGLREFWRVYAVLLALVVVGVIVALRFVEPPPPRAVVVAGGAAGGSYAATAALYAEALEAEDIEAEVLATAGSGQNLARLMAGEADIAIVQTGVAGAAEKEALRSLGGVSFEPLWVFHRADLSVEGLSDLAGLNLAIGEEGSGARTLALTLLAEAGVEEADFRATPLAGARAAEALRGGLVDAAVVVSGERAPWIAQLLAEPGVELMSMALAPALARRHPHLDAVTLHRGVIDPARDLPHRDVVLISPAAQLVVRADLHPAVQSLLLDAAFRLHGAGSFLADPGAFPDRALADLPLSAEARRYYERGPSFLRRWFPFGVANFLERAWVLAIPLVTLLIPVVRAAPPLYRWRIRRKIYVWYGDLRRLEAEGRAATSEAERMEVRARLAELQADAGEVAVPLSYTDDLYRLRYHISFVAALLDKLSAEAKHQRV